MRCLRSRLPERATASGRSTSTQRSYAMDLLRWFRSPGPSRCRGTRRPGWRPATSVAARVEGEASSANRWCPISSSLPNPVTGKPGLGRKYAVATRAHSETVLRVFYDFHRDAGTGPMVNPFPHSRERRGGRPNAHHNPMEPFATSGWLYRPRVAQRIPRCIPDEMFNRVFAELGCHRDRALVALWVSTGARPRNCSAPTAATSTPSAAHHSDRKGTVQSNSFRRLRRVRVASALPVRNQPGATVWT